MHRLVIKARQNLYRAVRFPAHLITEALTRLIGEVVFALSTGKAVIADMRLVRTAGSTEHEQQPSGDHTPKAFIHLSISYYIG